jgi:hypothetical protein|tara:strand:- start:10 stop:657 length:648 start_codon:yes stop_codon:yes gene_type:complete
MALLYSGTTDGYVYKYTTDTWTNNRDAATGSQASSTTHFYGRCIRTFHTSGRGGDTYFVGRAFFAFNTSGITSVPSIARLKIHGYSYTSADVIAVKATKPDGATGIAVADFDAITGFTAGASMSGNVTDYSAEISSWTTSTYNNLELNEDARSDMASLDVFAVCLVEYDHDYLNIAPSEADIVSGVWFADEEGTSKDPYLFYKLTDNATFFGANF